MAILVIAAIYLGRGTAAAEQTEVPGAGGRSPLRPLSVSSPCSVSNVPRFRPTRSKIRRRNVPLARSVRAGDYRRDLCRRDLGRIRPASECPGGKVAVAIRRRGAAVPRRNAGSAIAAFAAISALGCLNGWTLCAGEIPLKLARDGAARVVRENHRPGTPVRAQVVGCVVATLLVAQQ